MSNGPLYYPRSFIITAITNAVNALVTTHQPHEYKLAQIVRFQIPYNGGMTELDDKTATIIDIPSPTTFTVDIDTLSFNIFAVPPADDTPAQILPVGENTAYALLINVPILGDATFNTGLFE